MIHTYDIHNSILWNKFILHEETVRASTLQWSSTVDDFYIIAGKDRNIAIKIQAELRKNK